MTIDNVSYFTLPNSTIVIHSRIVLPILLFICMNCFSHPVTNAAPTKIHPQQGAVWAVSYSPDGKRFASGGTDKTVKIWSASDMECKAILYGHNGAIWTCAFAPDGKLLASGSCDRTIRLWSDTILIATLEGHTGIVTSIAFSPDGKLLASAGSDRSIRVWSLDTFKQVEINMRHTGCISSIAFSPDGESIISGSFDHTVRYWSLRSDESRIMGTHKDSVLTVAFSPDGRNIASGGGCSNIKIWNSTDGTLRQILATPDFAIITCIAYSPDGSLLTAGTQSGRIHLWKVDTLGQYSPDTKHNLYVSAVTFAPNGKTLISGSRDSSIIIWNVPPDQAVNTMAQGTEKAIVSVSCTPHSNPPLLASTCGDSSISLWSLENGTLLRTFPTFTNCSSVVFSHDGTLLAAGCGKHLVLYSVSSGKTTVLPIKHPEHDIQSIQFSPDNTDIAYIADGYSIFLYSIKDATITKLKRGWFSRGRKEQITCITFPPNNSNLIVAGGESGTINLWSTVKKKIEKKLGNFISSEKVTSICFTPDGSRYAVAGDEGTLQIRSFPNDFLIMKAKEIVSGIKFLCISGDGLLLATGNLDGTITIRSTKDLEIVAPSGALLNQQKIRSMSFSGNNPSLLISGGYDRCLRFWDVAYSRWMLTSFLISENDYITFNSDGAFVASDRVRKKCGEFGLEKNGFLPLAIDSQMTHLNEATTSTIVYDNDKDAIGTGIKNNPSLTKKDGRKYAIIIGIADYEHLTSQTPVQGLTDLKYCDKDAAAFKKFIEDSSRSGGNWEIVYLINQYATGIAIDTSITKTLKHAKKDDIVYIFFSGHARGHKDEPDRIYLLAYDFKPNDFRSGFEYGVLFDLIRTSEAGHVVAFIDACKSGVIGAKGTNSSASYNLDWLREKTKPFPPNKIIFTSASNTQVSWEDDEYHMGTFSYYLVRGLNGYASEYQDDYYINVYELAKYVENMVTERTQNNVLQKPDIFGFHIDDWYPLALRVRQ